MKRFDKISVEFNKQQSLNEQNNYFFSMKTPLAEIKPRKSLELNE